MIVAAAVLPHGDFVFDPTLIHDDPNGRSDAERLHCSAEQATDRLLALDLDSIALITPHGLAVEDDVAAYLGQRASGFAVIGRDVVDGSVQPYTFPMENISLDNKETKRLIEGLECKNCSISGIVSFGGYEDAPLRYGEIVPLSFIRGSQLKQRDAGVDTKHSKFPVAGLKYVLLSLPNKRYSHDVEMVSDMVDFGSNLYQHFESLSSRVAIVVSTDLAHTHLDAGPYGYSDAAQPFDNACAEWVLTMDGEPLLERAKDLVDDAKSCGYLGMVILHGVLSQLQRDAWDNELLSISHPTYYGMCVATFIRTI